MSNLTKRERRELRKQEKILEQKQRSRRKFLKRIILWTSIVFGISAVIFGMIKWVGNPPAGRLTNDAVSDSDWVKGNKEAKVVLIEYSDFQCSACANYVSIINQLAREFSDKAAFVYRHFPLPQHGNAGLAAQAAEAAGRQNKFWEMHDIIFENQKEWADSGKAEEYFIDYAKSLNLDIKQFTEDLDSKEIKDKIKSDAQSGLYANLNSTPSFFLNGQRIQNPRSYDDFRNIIQQSLNENS